MDTEAGLEEHGPKFEKGTRVAGDVQLGAQRPVKPPT